MSTLRKPFTALLLASLGLSLLANVFTYANSQRKLVETEVRFRWECALRLEELRGLTLTWADGQNGLLPSDLAFISHGSKLTPEKERVRMHPLLCPASESPVSEPKTSQEDSDFIYVTWAAKYSNWHDVPGDYPLFYDRRLSNHGGGVYLIRMDGLVIWDREASWLKAFATTHPEHRIELPK